MDQKQMRSAAIAIRDRRLDRRLIPRTPEEEVRHLRVVRTVSNS